MKRTTIGVLKEAKMSLKLYGTYFNKFFKYNPEGEDIVEIILKN